MAGRCLGSALRSLIRPRLATSTSPTSTVIARRPGSDRPWFWYGAGSTCSRRSGAGGLRLAVVQVVHPGRLATLDDHARDQGVGVDGEVRPGHGGVQVRGGGRAALAVFLR